MKKLLQSITLISLTALVLAACAPAINLTVVPTLTPQLTPTQIVSREAQVQNVEIQITNSTPAQVNTVVRGI
ncbi:MAG TPA: hypothetical protein VF918_02840 [Anaerolineales bacterium]